MKCTGSSDPEHLSLHKVPTDFVDMCGNRWPCCGACVLLAKAVSQGTDRNAKLVQASLIVNFLRVNDTTHIKYLKPVIHSSTKATTAWRKEPFEEFKEQCKVKRDFLEFKREDGAVLGSEMTSDWRMFLKNLTYCITVNKGLAIPFPQTRLA